jgi:hypothetical protein
MTFDACWSSSNFLGLRAMEFCFVSMSSGNYKAYLSFADSCVGLVGLR